MTPPALPHLAAADWAHTTGTDAFGPFAAVTVEGQTFRFRWIPPGRFDMGAPDLEPGSHTDEALHPVLLTQGLWLGETPVTQAQWTALTGHNPSRFQGGDDHPVESVSWLEAVQFCATFQSRVPGPATRLPTEAEWERACRAGTSGPNWDPSRPLAALAWANLDGGFVSHPVAQKLPNPWGLFDMLGNVSEWCADAYGRYDDALAIDPCATGGPTRVHRGGSWFHPVAYARAASRDHLKPHERGSSVGLRLARGPAGPAPPVTRRQTPAHPPGGPLSPLAPPPPPPAWAQAAGVDAFGAFALVEVNGVPFRFRWIPPGPFVRGSPPDEDGRDDDELQHAVVLTQGCYLGETPVTQAQWEAVTGQNPSHFSKGGAYPVESVSWEEGVRFCQAFQSASPGPPTRLPTEAEWEYACRAGTTGPRWDPTCPLGDLAWYEENAGGQTHPVARKKPNPWGLYDMLGNVLEWCADFYAPYPDGWVSDPCGGESERRVFRGGGWSDPAEWLRAAHRSFGPAGIRWRYLGLRLARASVLHPRADREPGE